MKFRSILSLLAIFSIVSIVLGQSLNSEALIKRSLESPNFVVPITHSDVTNLAGQRDYYTLLLLTTSDPQVGCASCEILDRVVRRVAESWYGDYALSNFLYFVEIDLADKSNANLFNYLGLGTVPHLWLIPPSKDKVGLYNDDKGYGIFSEPHLLFKLPVTGFEKQVKELTNFLSQNLHKTIKVKQQQPMEKFILAFGITFSFIMLLKKRGPKILTNLTKKSIYKALVIGAIIAFISGYNFTTMEKVPFLAKDGNNNLMYISGTFQYQLGIEILIVGFNYLALASSLINLLYLGSYEINATSKISSEKVKSFCILINVLIIYILSSCLTSAFIRKEPYYPYYFFKIY